MTQDTRNKIGAWHSRLKPYYSLIAVLLSTAALSWEITHTAFTIINGDTKELHANTAAIEQQRKDLYELKENTAASFAELKYDNQKRDNRIEQNVLDIKGLLTNEKSEHE
jgi:hypothetical protein